MAAILLQAHDLAAVERWIRSTMLAYEVPYKHCTCIMAVLWCLAYSRLAISFCKLGVLIYLIFLFFFILSNNDRKKKTIDTISY